MKMRVKACRTTLLAVALWVNAAFAGAHEDAVENARKLMERTTQLFNQGQFQQALPPARQALAIREKELGLRSTETAQTLQIIGRIYFQSADYAQAKGFFERAFAIREAVLGPEHVDTVRSYQNVALAVGNLGDYEKAEPMYQRVLAIHEKVRGPEDLETAIALNNLGSFYRTIGAYDKAEPLFLRVLAIREKVRGPEHPETAAALNHLGSLYRITGAYANAAAMFQRALAIREKVLGPEHADTAVSLNGLANLYVDMAAYQKAEPLYRRAVAIRQKSLGPDSPITAVTEKNLAVVYAATGEHSKAEPLLVHALAAMEKTLGSNHPDVAATRVAVADIYSNAGAYAKAEPLYLRSLTALKAALTPEHPAIIANLKGLAMLNWRTGNTAKALPLLEEALAAQAKNTKRFLASGSEARQHAYLQALTEDIYEYVSFSVAVPNSRSTSLGLTSVLQYKGRGLDEASSTVARLRASIDDADVAVFEQLTELTSQLSSLTYRSDESSATVNRKRVESLLQRQESLEAKLSERSAEFRREVAPVTIESVRRAIPEGSVLLEFLRYSPVDPRNPDPKTKRSSPRYAAYVLRRNGAPALVDIGDAGAIDANVQTFRAALGDPKNDTVVERAAILSRQLLQPLKPYTQGSRKLLISPDGALSLIPFAALVDEQNRYLAEHTEVAYVTSGRDVLRFAHASNDKDSIIFANPDYGRPMQLATQTPAMPLQRSADLDRSGFIFRPLASTLIEAQALKTLLRLDDRNVFVGENATEARLKQLHGPRILHIASHGFFLSDQSENAAAEGFDVQSENPLLRSGIALAGANERRSGATDDGILTALEAARLDLHGTELVVLSACDSGVGQIQNGEGVYGLRRAFAIAGAQTEIMSLWKVSDESTSKLMIDYYDRLMRGESRSASLFESQKSMLANPLYARPYYWAPFVSIGNPAPLTQVAKH